MALRIVCTGPSWVGVCFKLYSFYQNYCWEKFIPETDLFNNVMSETAAGIATVRVSVCVTL